MTQETLLNLESNLDKINELNNKENKNPDEILFKLSEELGELISVRNSIARDSYKKETEDHRKEEITDVFQCIVSYLLKYMAWDELNTLLAVKNTKWEAKYIKEGKLNNYER